MGIFRWRICFLELPLNTRKSYLRRYDFLAYMQVTAAFARKLYLHLISLITPLLISIFILILSQNLSLDLFHHHNERKLLLHLMIFQEKRFCAENLLSTRILVCL